MPSYCGRVDGSILRNKDGRVRDAMQSVRAYERALEIYVGKCTKLHGVHKVTSLQELMPPAAKHCIDFQYTVGVVVLFPQLLFGAVLRTKDEVSDSAVLSMASDNDNGPYGEARQFSQASDLNLSMGSSLS